MVWILPKLSNYQQVAPSVRTGGSRHTGLAAPPHRNIQLKYAVINGRLDEDLYQELCITLMRAIDLFRI